MKLVKVDDGFPSVKTKIDFLPKFSKKVKGGKKDSTYRNSPVELGIYADGDFKIEVVMCMKIDGIKGDNIGGYESLGFESAKECEEFYLEYFKYDFAYYIEWERL